MEQEFKRGQMTFYKSYAESIALLPKSKQGEAYQALVWYGLDGVLPENVSPPVRALFAAVRPNLDNGRAKAAARIRDRDKVASGEDFDSPTGKNKNKRENKKEYKNEYKKEREVKNENKNEYENEREDEIEVEKEAEAENKSQPEGAPGSARDELDRVARTDPQVGELISKLTDRWQRLGQPLSSDERNRMAWALAVHEPDEQRYALNRAIHLNQRTVSQFPTPGS